MADGAVFRCAGIGMLRAPVHPVHPEDVDPGGRVGAGAVLGAAARGAGAAAARWRVGEQGRGAGASGRTGDVRAPSGEEIGAVQERLRRLADDPLVREAVEVSSPSLAAVLGRVVEGEGGRGEGEDRHGDELDAGAGGLARGVKPAALRRGVRALTGYRLRMAARATPFGLMAGVAPVEFVDEVPKEGAACGVRARWGVRHRRGARADREWLTGLVAEWERRPEVLPYLRVVVNDLCRVRGGRLVLPYVPSTGGATAQGRSVREVSVRYSPPVAAVLELARSPLECGELATLLRERFPEAPEGVVEEMLVRLVEREMLLTDARAPLEAADPLAHVLEALEPVPREALPERERLREVRGALEEYASSPPGRGREALAEASSRMRRLRPGKQLVQVDTALDADVRLPRAVVEEAERAARLLWRLSPARPGSRALRQYHGEFLGRYGTDRLVPVTELLDEGTGLGPPPGYRWPPAARGPRPEAPPEDADRRDRVLAALAQEALLAGEEEVVLHDDHPAVTELARDEGTGPASLELCAQVLAKNPEALVSGSFRLALVGMSERAGALMGRFAYLLPSAARAALAETARAGVPSQPDVVTAQLAFQAGRSRAANVAQVPRWLDAVLPVASFADRSRTEVLGVERLAVGADTHRLTLHDTETGRRVVPAAFHSLNPEWDLPNTARFLLDVAQAGVRPVRPWDWGAAGALPYLPRVRYGRTVLAPARWRPSEAVRDQSAGFGDWERAVREWRDRWRVPRRVCAGSAGRFVELDLEDPAHLELLRHELGRGGGGLVHEAPTAAGCPDGWLTGPDGPHRAEVVFPLLNRGGPARPEPAATSARPAGAEGAPTAGAAGALPAQRSGDGPGGGRGAGDGGEARGGAGVVAPGSTPSPVGGAFVPGAGVRRPLSVGVERREQLPGGEWVSAALYCPAERHDEVLGFHLPPLLAELPGTVDRWFFVRYRDAHGWHLRMRFHSDDPRVLAAELLPRLHSFAAGLRDSGYTRRLTLDTYDPEVERYGGPTAMPAAERVFHADSVAALEQLRLPAGLRPAEPALLAAANYEALCRSFLTGFGEAPSARSSSAARRPDGDGRRMEGEGHRADGRELWGSPADGAEPPWTSWLLEHYPKQEDAHRHFVARRKQTCALVTPDGESGWPHGVPEDSPLHEAWRRRDEALVEYGRTLRELGPERWSSASGALASLLHMHYNRLTGPDREGERVSYALARGALQAHRDRERHAR